jgi:hypothetical protein
MNPLVWIALIGGGLYLVTRKGETPAAGTETGQTGTQPGTEPGKGLLIPESIKAKFDENMMLYKAAFEIENKKPFTNEAQALKSLTGDDDRARAVAMAEFAKTATESKGKNNALSDAAQKLSLSYRDVFSLSNRGAKADKLIEEVITFVNNKLDASKAQPLDKAFVELVVDSPMMAVISEPVSSVTANPQSLVEDATSSDDRDYNGLIYEIQPLKPGQSKPDTTQIGTASISANADYQLDSYSIASDSPTAPKTLAYIGMVKAGEPKFGKYILTFALAPKA